MIAKRCRSAAIASGPSLASSHTPRCPACARGRRSSRRASHSASGTMTSPCVGASGSSPWGPRLSRRQLSAAMRCSLISVAIDRFLEGFDADAVHHVDETLGVAVAPGEVALDQLLDHVGDLRARERRADHLAQRRTDAGPDLALIAADLDLVPLLAVLVDAEYADVADVMVAAGIHATRDIDVDLADVVQVAEVHVNTPGCMNACGHHHVGHIGILGVDKHGEEWYQITLGGSANGFTALGEVIGPSVPKTQVAATIERIVEAYRTLRAEGERFIDTFRRVGLAPFRESAYATHSAAA